MDSELAAAEGVTGTATDDEETVELTAKLPLPVCCLCPGVLSNRSRKLWAPEEKGRMVKQCQSQYVQSTQINVGERSHQNKKESPRKSLV